MIYDSAFMKRNNDSYKGDFGHVLIIGGDYGMGGAVIMAAEAAYRVGAGKVTILSREENFVALLTRLPNAMTTKYDGDLAKNLTGKTVIVIGCGLGKSEWATSLVAQALASNSPKIIDADALNIISESDKKIDLHNSIITPHVGEAARLLGISPSQIQQDRQKSAQNLQQKFNAITVLKGSGSLVVGKEIYQCHYGNPGMATAGMGDILSGIIGGLVAQNLDLEKAARFGVTIHAQAGDLVAKHQGQIGMMPQDLFSYLPRLVNGLE